MTQYDQYGGYQTNPLLCPIVRGTRQVTPRHVTSQRGMPLPTCFVDTHTHTHVPSRSLPFWSSSRGEVPTSECSCKGCFSGASLKKAIAKNQRRKYEYLQLTLSWSRGYESNAQVAKTAVGFGTFSKTYTSISDHYAYQQRVAFLEGKTK